MEPRIKGKIAAYCDDVNAGTITGEDDKTYLFSRKNWMAAGEPAVGVEVSFIIEGDRAASVNASG